MLSAGYRLLLQEFYAEVDKFDLELHFLRTVNTLVIIFLMNIMSELLRNSTQLQLVSYLPYLRQNTLMK